MLTAAFPKLENLGFVKALRAFYRSPWYCALIAALMAISEIFGAELPVYYIYFVLGAACLLLCEDTLGIIPIACCGYMTFSAQANPTFSKDPTFSHPEALFQLGVILAFGVILLFGRMMLSLWELPKKRVPRLAIGFAVLGVAYMLAGAFSGFYAFDTVLYGFVQIVSLCGFYFFFYYSVDWRKVKGSYIAVVFFAIGAGMLAEIIGMYFLPGVFDADGNFHYGALGTGWGVYNNVGCIMAMCIPAPFYFAAKNKFGWAYAIVGCVYFLGVVLTQSRGSTLCAVVVFGACIIASLIKAKKFEKIGIAAVIGAFVLTAVIVLLVKKDMANVIFGHFVQRSWDDAGRFNIYKNCWQDFLDAPAFGKGFYHSSGVGWDYNKNPNSFIPPRAHNTYFQLLASGGIVAMLAYLYHRAETFWVCFRRPTTEKMFAGFAVGALILTSLLDCNFFNIGPGILYGTLLVFAECTDPTNRLYRKKKNA